MKIYVDKKPENCGLCPLVNVSVLDVMENREMVLQHICPIMDLSVDPDNLDANCPLTELKPNKLNWELSDITGLYSALNGKYTISSSRIYEKEPIFYSCFFLGIHIHLENRDTINDAKAYCQEEHNKLFWEMVGVKK